MFLVDLLLADMALAAAMTAARPQRTCDKDQSMSAFRGKADIRN